MRANSVVPAQSPNPRRQQIAPRPGAPAMTPQQKAAVIVRLLLAEGVDPGLNKLQDNQQEVLAREMADMRYITRIRCAGSLVNLRPS